MIVDHGEEINSLCPMKQQETFRSEKNCVSYFVQSYLSELLNTAAEG